FLGVAAWAGSAFTVAAFFGAAFVAAFLGAAIFASVSSRAWAVVSVVVLVRAAIRLPFIRVKAPVVRAALAQHRKCWAFGGPIFGSTEFFDSTKTHVKSYTCAHFVCRHAKDIERVLSTIIACFGRSPCHGADASLL